MIEASTTRRPSTPAHAQRRIDHGPLVDAHAAGADRMVDRVGPLADQLAQRLRIVSARSRRCSARRRARAAAWRGSPGRSPPRGPAFRDPPDRTGSSGRSAARSRRRAPRACTVPRLFGLRSQTCSDMPVVKWSLRLWSSTIPMQKWSCRSGLSMSGRLLTKPPASAAFEVRRPLPRRRKLAISAGPCGEHRPGQAEQARPFGAQVGDVVAMVLQVGADVGRVLNDLDSEALAAPRPGRRPKPSGAAANRKRRRRGSPRAGRRAAPRGRPGRTRRRRRACPRTRCAAPGNRSRRRGSARATPPDRRARRCSGGRSSGTADRRRRPPGPGR